jgi:RNA polymerase sigma factor (sigma-70 family)
VSASEQPAPRPDLPPDSFQGLIEHAAAGKTGACQRLYDQYHDIVLGVVRRHLQRRLRTMLDSIDVTQNVWKSLFGILQGGQPFAGPNEFLAYLTGIARNKTLLENRQAIEVEKRSLSHEEPLAKHAGEVIERPDPAASPTDRAAIADEWDKFLQSVPEDVRLAFVALRRGESQADVAARLGVSVRTLRRRVQHYVREHFCDERDEQGID